MDTRQLIGLETSVAVQLLADSGNTSQVCVFTDRKQCHFDKEIVVRVTIVDGVYKLIVCPIQVAVLGEHA